MNILALDLATKTGWAHIENGQLRSSGMIDFTKKRGEDNGILFLKFRKWLLEFLNNYNIDVIPYEQAHFRGGAATELCVGMQTHCQSAAREMGCNLYPVHTGTLKLWATGHGNSPKSKVMKKAEQLANKSIKDDNESDAICIGFMASEELTPDI